MTERTCENWFEDMTIDNPPLDELEHLLLRDRCPYRREAKATYILRHFAGLYIQQADEVNRRMMRIITDARRDQRIQERARTIQLQIAASNQAPPHDPTPEELRQLALRRQINSMPRPTRQPTLAELAYQADLENGRPTMTPEDAKLHWTLPSVTCNISTRQKP